MRKNKIIMSTLLLLLLNSCDLLENSNLKEIIRDKKRTERCNDDHVEKQNVAPEEKVYDMVEEMPEFPGGMNALLRYVSETVQYPEVAKKEGVQGRVLVTFIVDKDGTVADAKVMRGLDASLDEEALRIVNGMPRWKPGKDKGENVKVRFTLPVRFNLAE